MSETQISADDITRWETLDDIAASLQKRGLEPRPDIERDGGYDDEFLMEVEEDRYIALINAGPGDDPTNYNRRQTRTVPTNLRLT